jgi:hypothetical protein
MDERPKNIWRWFALAWLPLALILLVPVVIVLGVSFYVRAAAVGIYGLIRSLLGFKPALPVAATQPPHLFEIPAAEKKLQK